jgi:hypothetical protein
VNGHQDRTNVIVSVAVVVVLLLIVAAVLGLMALLPGVLNG